MVANLGNNLIELFKKPITTMIEKKEQDDYKKIGIRAAIIAAIVALINALSTVRAINARVKAFKGWGNVDDFKKEMFEEAELFETALESFITFAVVMAVIGLILFVISKLIKSPINYKDAVSITTKAFMFYATGMIINFILAYIYSPLGLLISIAGVMLTIVSLSIAFKELVQVDDLNKFAMFTAGVLAIALMLVVIYLQSKTKISLKEFVDGLNGLGSIGSLF